MHFPLDHNLVVSNGVLRNFQCWGGGRVKFLEIYVEGLSAHTPLVTTFNINFTNYNVNYTLMKHRILTSLTKFVHLKQYDLIAKKNK